MFKIILRRWLFLPALAAASLFTSCSTDIDLLEDYKPITVVYGLLNVNDPIQYIKINKAFLGEGNALVMAQQSDSINYQPNELQVILQRINPQTGEVLQEIACLDTTGIPKESGTFSNPYQLLYYTYEPIDQNSSYKLLIHRLTDGATITASTPVVNQVTVTSPTSPSSVVSFYNSTQTYRTFYLTWKHSADAEIYTAALRFTYYETLLTAPFTTDTITLEWNLGEVLKGSAIVGEAKRIEMKGENFFSFIESSVQPNVNVSRSADEYLELLLSAGAEDLHTYIEVNEPSIGLIQEKPVFTNVSNGTGIFSSRWNIVLRNKMDSPTLAKANQVIQ